MQTTSALWRSMAASGTALLRTKATIDGVDYTDMLPPVVRRALMDNAVSIGNCVSASLTLDVKTDNSTTENIPRSAQVLLSMWWEDEAGNVSETLPVGTFYVSHRQYSNRTKRMTLECYDAMLKANAPIGDAGIASWPAQIGSVVSAIAAAMGVDVDSRNYYRSATLTIPEPAEGSTMRDVLGGIAALNGGNWYITPAGKLRLKWIHHQGPTDLVEYGSHPEWVTSDVVQEHGVTGGMFYDVIPGEGGDRYTITGLRVINESGEQMKGNDNGVVVTLRSDWADSGWINWLYGDMRFDYWWPVIIEGAFYDPAAELGDWLTFEIWFEIDGEAAFTDGYCMLCMETITLGPAPRANVSMPAPGEVEDEYPYVSSAEQEALQTRTRLDALEDRLDALDDPVDVAHGGTGATTAANARVNLGITRQNIGLYTSVTQLGLTSGSATILAAFEALSYGSTLTANASNFASSEVPNSYGTVVIDKSNGASRSFVLFYGKRKGDSDYRMYLGSTSYNNNNSDAPTGTWVQNVTGVKGGAESSYRTGNVNLTPENIGAVATADSGTRVNGTKASPSCANGGGEATAATLELSKGKWIVFASGYSPIIASSKVVSQATTIRIQYGSSSYDGGVSLTYRFNVSRFVSVTSDSATIDLKVINWESYSVDALETNYDFYAVRIS